ncbi:MAG: hypothetical protein IK020_01575 [Clostridiales bacterium]|nr:hypothetical protein [Clostridiales bacterium]
MLKDRTITPEMLSFKDFMAAFRAQYRYGYPQFYGKYSVTEQKVRKNNRELHGLIIRTPGNHVAPVFYYEDFYKAYKNGTTIDECIRTIIRFVENKNLPDNEFGERLTSWEKNRERLVLKMINFKKNRHMLMHAPFRRFGDMAVIVQIYMTDPNLGEGAITVDDDLAEIWSKSSKELFETALSNMNNYPIKMMDLMELSSCEEEDDMKAPRIYLATYDAAFHGASVILQTDVLLDFAKEKSMDFYVMPVSTHEILLIEQREDVNNAVLFEMLESINSDDRIPENMISEEVYSLDREQHCLRSLSSGEQLILAEN